ncbi:NtaA/DmoA family FMN-dependent monooxygenase [Agromyces sp. NPDC056523]|uniref:NtaA/DmoA family FMN-dependent monooxygenase n=1 Tax=Agromyces sp. NPDC056523 TaxID=3345850 RepID=UPI0036724991
MGRLIIGAMVRTIGAHPAGWRLPGAHRDPKRDAAALRHTARVAEEARLDYLFFGERRVESQSVEHREPHLVARVESLSAVTYLAGLTEHIGLVGSADTNYAEPYALARQTASLDLLSGGRAGINLVTDIDPSRASGELASDAATAVRYDRATEFETVLRRLWDSVGDHAIVADPQSGVFVDTASLHAPGFRGTHFEQRRPLDVPRPVQGHLPVFHSGSSPRSRLYAALNADVAVVAVRGLAHAAAIRAELRSLAFESGRDDRTLSVVAPVLPIVGESMDHAQHLADRLSSLVRVADDWLEGPPPGFPDERSLVGLSRLVGIDLRGADPDGAVTAQLASRFTSAGQELVELVITRTGRRPGGDPAVTFRHLIAAASVNLAIMVGTPSGIAEQFATWHDAGAVDGFNVLSATHPAQLEAFASGVVPELQRLGVFPSEYEGTTLRDHLGLERPDNVHRSASDPRFPPIYRRDPAARTA